MKEIALFILGGAFFPIATGFVTNYLEYRRKKDHFIFGLIHEANVFIKLTNEISRILDTHFQSDVNLQQDNNWLNITFPNLCTKISNSRGMSERNSDWIIAIKNNEVREKVENFYIDTSIIIAGLKYCIQERANFLTFKSNYIKQLVYNNQLSENEDVDQKLAKLIPLELSAFVYISNIYVAELRKLIGYHTLANNIKSEVIQEFSYLSQLRGI